MIQQRLFDDERPPLPERYRAQFRADRTCWACGVTLNHELHVHNHWLKYHTKKRDEQPAAPGPFLFFYVWHKQRQAWCAVTQDLYDRCHEAGFCTCRSRVRLWPGAVTLG